MKKRELIENGYEILDKGSKSVIRSEIRGFLPILQKWVEYENEPKIKVRLTKGDNAGQVKEFCETVAELIIENSFGVAVCN